MEIEKKLLLWHFELAKKFINNKKMSPDELKKLKENLKTVNKLRAELKEGKSINNLNQINDLEIYVSKTI